MLKTTAVIVYVSLVSTLVMGDELNVPCQSSTDCWSMEGSDCDLHSEKCVCPGGQVPSTDLSRCLNVAENYGATCEENSQCSARLGAGGICEGDRTCACKEGFHYLRGLCWRSVGLNGSCARSEQCFENYNFESLSCGSEGRCVCSPGFYLRGSTHCRRAGKATGDECTFDMDCKCETHAGKCDKYQCVCEDDPVEPPQTIDYEEAEATEPQYVEFRNVTSCEDNLDCSELGPHAECNTGNTCWCAHGYYLDTSSNACLPELGESCSQSENCSHIKYSTCRQREGEGSGSYCSCTAQFTSTADNRLCSKLAKNFGFNCKSPEMCLNFGPLAVCAEQDTEQKQCGCSNTSHFQEDQQMCWISLGVNETCSSEMDCGTPSGVDGVTCEETSGTCQCVEGYHDASGDCRRDATALGEPCVDDVDCMFDNSRCVDGVCGCEFAYFQNGTDDQRTCVGGIGSPCSVTEDCVVDKAVCNETCICDPQYSPQLVSNANYSTCLKVSVNYGGACLEDVQCQTVYGSNSGCLDDICVCHESFHFRDHFCWPITALGQKCSRTSECHLSDDSDRSECRNGICECLYEYEQKGTDICVSGGNILGIASATLILASWICFLLK